MQVRSFLTCFFVATRLLLVLSARIPKKTLRGVNVKYILTSFLHFCTRNSFIFILKKNSFLKYKLEKYLNPSNKSSQIAKQKTPAFRSFHRFYRSRACSQHKLGNNKTTERSDISRHACPESLVHSTLHIVPFAFCGQG